MRKEYSWQCDDIGDPSAIFGLFQRVFIWPVADVSAAHRCRFLAAVVQLLLGHYSIHSIPLLGGSWSVHRSSTFGRHHQFVEERHRSFRLPFSKPILYVSITQQTVARTFPCFNKQPSCNQVTLDQ